MKFVQNIFFHILCLSFITLNERNASGGSVSVTETAAAQIAAATQAEKVVFLIVFDKADKNKNKAISIAQQAADKKPHTIEIIELNITDPVNNELITKYRLSGATYPLILLLDKNGTPVGSLLPTEASPSNLLKLIPSAKYSEILKALYEEKAVFIIAYRESMTQKDQAITNCKEAARRMQNKAVIVLLNIDLKDETSLLKDLKVKSNISSPRIVIINKSGQIIGACNAGISIEDLVAKGNKVIKGCCPGGGGNGCNPK